MYNVEAKLKDICGIQFYIIDIKETLSVPYEMFLQKGCIYLLSVTRLRSRPFFIGAGDRISVRSEPDPDLEQSRSRSLNEKVPAWERDREEERKYQVAGNFLWTRIYDFRFREILCDRKTALRRAIDAQLVRLRGSEVVTSNPSRWMHSLSWSR